MFMPQQRIALSHGSNMIMVTRKKIIVTMGKFKVIKSLKIKLNKK